MARSWHTPRPRRRRPRRLGVPARIGGKRRFALKRAIRTVSLTEINEAEKRNVAAAIAHQTDLRFIDTLESIAAQLEGVGQDMALDLEPDTGEGADAPATEGRTPALDPPVCALATGDLEALPENDPEVVGVVPVAETELEAGDVVEPESEPMCRTTEPESEPICRTTEPEPESEAVAGSEPAGGETVDGDASETLAEESPLTVDDDPPTEIVQVQRFEDDKATEVVPVQRLEDEPLVEEEEEAADLGDGELELEADDELDDDALELDPDEDDLELEADDLELEPDEMATLPGVPPPQPPPDPVEGTTEVVRVPPSEEELLAGAAQLGPMPTMSMPEPDPDEGVTEIVRVPPPEGEADEAPAPAATLLGPPAEEPPPAEEAIVLEEEPPALASLDDPPEDDPAFEEAPGLDADDVSWEGPGLESWDGHSLEEYMGRPPDSNAAMESWDGHSLEEYLGRPPDSNAAMESWDGHSLEEYLGRQREPGAPASPGKALESWDGHSLEEYLGRGLEGDDSMASWDGQSLEEYLGTRVAETAVTEGAEGVAGALPPTADPDDEVQKEAADYLQATGVPGVDAELDLEPIQADDGDIGLADEMDEVMDLVSDTGGEAAVAAALSLPPVEDGGGSLAEAVDQVSADPDTIVAQDEAEPIVDYLQTSAVEEPRATALEPLSPAPMMGGPGEDAPDWLDPRGDGREGSPDETTGEEAGLTSSLDSIPASARLSSLSLSGVDEDDDLDLDLDAEGDEPPTPARSVRRHAPAEQLPAGSRLEGEGKDPAGDPDGT